MQLKWEAGINVEAPRTQSGAECDRREDRKGGEERGQEREVLVPIAALRTGDRPPSGNR